MKSNFFSDKFDKMKLISASTVLLVIIISGFIFRIWLAGSDAYLHDWDERFHALIAENMMDHPFKPMLIRQPVGNNYDPFNWTRSHIWVHKQPLFLWQMALSMRLFGVSEWSMRLPSLIMDILMILLVYRIAFLFTNHKKTALLAAALQSFSYYFITLSSGVQGMDHNDVAFTFYVLAGIWAYSEYLRTPRWYWIVLIGLFSGAAILNKWLTGLLVFLIWGINLLWDFRKQHFSKSLLHFSCALLLCCIVFVPWQIYIFHQFPTEAAFEMEFNRRHITEVIEEHSGTIWYYYHHLYNLLGNGCWILLPTGMLLAVRKRKMLQPQLLRGLMVSVLFVFVFFSFMVQTKSYNYLSMITPPGFIFIAFALMRLLQYIKRPVWSGILVLLALFDSLNPVKIGMHVSSDNEERNVKLYNTRIYKGGANYLPAGVKVVLNLGALENIAFMFYNNKVTAYAGVLSEQDMQALAERHVPVAAFINHDQYVLPDYVLKYPYLYLIKRELK